MTNKRAALVIVILFFCLITLITFIPRNQEEMLEVAQASFTDFMQERDINENLFRLKIQKQANDELVCRWYRPLPNDTLSITIKTTTKRFSKNDFQLHGDQRSWNRIFNTRVD